MDKIKIFKEFEYHLLNDNKPSEYFNKILRDTDIFTIYPFDMIGKLVEIEQNPMHHPEGNVWNHTMLVIDNAADRKYKTDNKREFMWAALLHDIGKGPTTKLKNGRLVSYDHDIVGSEMAVDFLNQFTNDKEFIKNVSILVRWHMQILFVVKKLPFARLKEMTDEISPDEIALLGICDRLGRGNMSEEKEREEENNIKLFLEEAYKFIKNK